MSRRSPATTVLAILLSTTLLALAPSRAQYLGGTVSVKVSSEGIFDTGGSAATITFVSKDKKDGNMVVAYESITELEYGQKAGHRVAATVTKTGDHVLTISFKDGGGQDQAAVFELGKDIVKPTLDILKGRTGKPIECQNSQATHDYKGCSVIGGGL
jgi:hypothetical protein